MSRRRENRRKSRLTYFPPQNRQISEASYNIFTFLIMIGIRNDVDNYLVSAKCDHWHFLIIFWLFFVDDCFYFEIRIEGGKLF